jgi:drug/metabolite transporter (DMT)-like permease
MSGLALTLALLAAVLHAGWNLVAARNRDIEAVTAVALAIGIVALAPFAAATWDFEAEALPYAAASAAFELAYFALLGYAYRHAPVSVVYPVARGGAPVVVLVVSVLVLGADLSAGQAAGVAVVTVGILMVRGFGQQADARALLLGLCVAAAIAAYTLVDDQGVRHAGALSYMAVVHVPVALVLLGRIGRERARDAFGPQAAGIGLALVGAYVLVLAALELGPAAPVAALRETSVVMVALATALLGHERIGPARAAGAALVTAGIVAVAL